MTENSHMETGALRKAGLGLYVLVLAPTVALCGFQAAFSIALGGALAMINLALLEAGLAVSLSPTAGPAPVAALAMGSFYIRLCVTGGVILGFNNAGWVNIHALVAGLSIPLAGATAYFLMVRPLMDWYERAY